MMLAAGAAVLGALAGAAGPVARWWGRRNGHTGTVLSLLREQRQQIAQVPEKVPVTMFPPTPKLTLAQTAAGLKAEVGQLAALLRAQTTTPQPESNTPGGAYGAALPTDTVIRIAVPEGTKPEIFRAAWPEV